MVRRLLKDERGYSLIEVMVSIIILALAIIPMVGMFDMGLNGVTASSHYDKARTLANLKLEEAKNLPFTDVEDNFPEAGITTPYDGSDWFTRREPTLRGFSVHCLQGLHAGVPAYDDSAPSRNFDHERYAYRPDQANRRGQVGGGRRWGWSSR